MRSELSKGDNEPDIAPPPQCIARFVNEYRNLDEESLINILGNCAKVTMEQLLRAAAAIYVAAEMGKDLRPVLVGFFKAAALVAHGQLLPEAAVEFSGRPSVLNRFARLPEHEQRMIMNRHYVEVAFLTDGGHDVEAVDLSKITPVIGKLVFDLNRLFSIDEQVAALKREAAVYKRLPGLPSFVKIDKRRHHATINGVVLRAGQLSTILAALAGD